MVKCAYCDNVGKCTREHVVNSAFLKKFFKIGRGYSNKEDRYTANYPVINDVCAVCNNGALSKLDEYFLSFYVSNLPIIEVTSSTYIEVNYDFEKLSKWLLKTLYNCERKNGYHILPKQMSLLRKYIISENNDHSNFRVYIELLKDIPLDEIKLAFNGSDSGIDVPTKLNFLRLGNSVFVSEIENKKIDHIIKYFVSSNFIFHIFIVQPHQKSDDYIFE